MMHHYGVNGVKQGFHPDQLVLWGAQGRVAMVLAYFSMFACGSTDRTTEPHSGDAGGSVDGSSTQMPSGGSSGVGSTGGTLQGGFTGMVEEDGEVGGGNAGAPEIEGTGNIAIVGTPCEKPGVLACAGNHQKVSLVCGHSDWIPNQTCKSGEFCDSRSGPDVGLCQPEAPECAGHIPGFRFCADRALRECNADNLEAPIIETCEGVCEIDRCVEGPSPPCPEAARWTNCSRDCDDALLFVEGYCYGGRHLEWTPSDGSIVRLPFAMDALLCESGRRFLTAHVLPHGGAVGARLRVTTSGSWRVLDAPISSKIDPHAICYEPGGGDQCHIIVESSYLENYDFWFISDDPNALPANITIEMVPYGTMCD